MPGEHKDIIEAVISANPEAARAAMQKHMEKFCKNLLEMETEYRQKTLMVV